MILDKGVCSVYQRVNIEAPGAMPQAAYERIAVGWYGQLAFASTTSYVEDVKQDTTIAMRIRILQDTRITTHHLVALVDAEEPPKEGTLYSVARAYHGTDRENGQPITDLELEVTRP